MKIDGDVIESKTVVLSVIRYSDNYVREERQSDTAHGGSVCLVEGAADGWFVADNGAIQEGVYKLYSFDTEEQARDCYATCVAQVEDNEAIEKGDS